MKENIQKIKKLVAEDEIEKAFEVLANAYNENDIMRDIILQKRRYQALLKDNNLGIATYSEITIEKNKIAKAILDLVQEMEEVERQPKFSIKKSYYAYIIGAILLILVSISGYNYSRYMQRIENKQHILSLDKEIATRIARIDIPSWYRVVLLNDTVIDLHQRLIARPDEELVILEDYKTRNLRSLIEELHDRVPVEERQAIETALKELHKIETEYNDGLLAKNPRYVINFCEDLFNLNIQRWVRYNHMDEERREEILKSLPRILEETFR